jgi:ABC-type bacteriocin/lantibiotic exporter with double-glycine peptidase domain
VVDGAAVKRRFLVPEVIQTSAMDCGPAALKALFGGFGIYLSYGRLREACQTDVDGTSIDTLQDVVAKAVDLLNRAVATLERQLAPDHPHLAAARRNLLAALSSAARPG